MSPSELDERDHPVLATSQLVLFPARSLSARRASADTGDRRGHSRKLATTDQQG